MEESFDAAYVNNTKLVKLRTALELFNFDKNASAQYQYHGTKQIRQINCDVWIAIRDNFPPIENVTSTWEWYFMTADWTVNHKIFFNDYLNICFNLVLQLWYHRI